MKKLTHKVKGSPQMQYFPEILIAVNHYYYMEQQADKLL